MLSLFVYDFSLTQRQSRLSFSGVHHLLLLEWVVHVCIFVCLSYLVMPPSPYGGGITQWWQLSVRLSVRLSVCPVPDPKSRMEGPSRMKIGRKEAHTGDSW